MKKKILLLLLLVAIVIAGSVIYKKNYATDRVQLKRGPVKELIYGLGTVVSRQVYEHKHGILTHVQKLHVLEGSEVNKGDLLMTFSEGSPLRAPFAGTVTHLLVHEGENVFPQGIVLRLQDLKDREVEVSLEQQGALRVRAQQKTRMSFESLRGDLYTGSIKVIYPSEGQFVVRIKPDQLPSEILPGMTVDVAIEIAQRENVLLAPLKAVKNGKMTIIEDGRKKKIDIKTGATDGDFIEVLSTEVNENTWVVLPR